MHVTSLVALCCWSLHNVSEEKETIDTPSSLQENLSLNKRVHEMAGQMMELRSLLQAVKDDNERLSSSWQSASDVRSLFCQHNLLLIRLRATLFCQHNLLLIRLRAGLVSRGGVFIPSVLSLSPQTSVSSFCPSLSPTSCLPSFCTPC